MEQTNHHPNNKTPQRDDVIYCDSYFTERPLSSWNYQDFLTYCTRAGPAKLDVLNSRYLKALEKIESCRTERQDRRKKARSLIDKHRNSVSITCYPLNSSCGIPALGLGQACLGFGYSPA